MPRFSDIVVRSSTVAAFIVSAMSAANAGIDLTPSPSEYVAEGMKHQQLTFVQDKQRIEYEPPPSWAFDSSARLVKLIPPQKHFAEATIEAIPLTKPQSLDENIVKTLEQQFVAGLPPGSQFVTLVSAEQNPILLNGNRTLEVTASYQLMGEKFLKSALFINLPDTQLIFRFTARKDDFEALHQIFRTSILSWQWVENTEPTSAQTTNAEPSLSTR